MKIKLPGFSKKAMTILVMICFIGIGYAYYFLGYVKNNEIAYQKKAYRVLDRIGNNIQEKNKNNLKNIESLLYQIRENESSYSNLNENPEIDKLYATYDSLMIIQENKSYELNDLQIKQKKSEHTKKQEKNIEKEIKNIDLQIVQLEDMYYELLDADDSNYNYVDFEKHIELFNLSNNNGLQISSNETLASKKKIEIQDGYVVYNEKICSNKKSENCDKWWQLSFKNSLKEFINPILRKDIFDEFIILNQSDSTTIIHQTFKNKIQLHDNDSLFHYKSAQYKSKNHTIISGDTKYKVFVYNFLFENNESNLLIAGCIKENNYLTEIRSISFWVIINSSLFIILLIFGMPTLKLALMNSIERLHRTNVFLTGLSIIMGTLFIVLLFLMGISYRHDISKIDMNLDTLASNVTNKFTNELKTSIKQLSTYDSICKTPLDYSYNQYNYNSLDGYLPDSISMIYPDFNLVFWMNHQGSLNSQISPDLYYQEYSSGFNNNRLNLDERNYYKAAEGDSLWMVPKIKPPFYMQSIISWTTREREIVVSKRGIDSVYYPYTAIAAEFKSVIEPILPFGYGFSIINAQGDVLIHSNSNKNLQENFIHESKNDAALESAIYGKNALKTNVSYLGRNHRIRIEPLAGGMPLYVIVHHDLSILKSKISEIWSTSLFFIINSFLIIAVLMLIINILKKKKTKLLTKQFFFHWLAPKTKNLLKYKQLIKLNLLLSLILIIVFSIITLNDLIHIVIICLIPISSFIITYSILSKKNSNTIEQTTKLKSIYTKFLLSWLILSSIIPMIYIYKTSYAIESNIWSKHTLIEFGNSIENQIKRDKNNNPKTLLNLVTLNSDSTNIRGIYNDFLNIHFNTDDNGFKSVEHSKFRNNILFKLRPSYNDEIIKSKGLVYNNSKDYSFFWKQNKDEILLLRNVYSGEGKTETLFLSKPTNDLNFSMYQFKLADIFIILLLIISPFALYKIITFCVNKIYGLEFNRPLYYSDITKEIVQNNNTIIIGLPSSGKTTFVRDAFENNKNYLLVNCTTINHKNEDGKNIYNDWNFDDYKTIILDNFEYNNDDHDTNTKKLRILEKLQNQNKHIIITSEIEPAEILDMYNRAIIKTQNNEEVQKGYEDELEIWRHIFSNFVEVYKPLGIKTPTVLTENSTANNIEVLINELKHGSFLQRTADALLKKGKDLEEEDLILEIQNYSKSYYYALWNALTEKEKYAVFDMAKDGFINTKNRQVINTLLKKGILIYENDKLDLLNKSFKNFVLSVLSGTEIQNMDTKVRNKGKWVNIRLAIILIVISLIILIGFGKPDFFKNINAIMIALAGVMTVMPTLSRAFTLTQKIK